MSKIESYSKAADFYGRRSLWSVAEIPVRFCVDRLDKEEHLTYKGCGGSLRSYSGKGTFLVQGVGETDEVSSMLVYREESIIVDIDVEGMHVSCSIDDGNGGRYYLDPSYVDYLGASYLGEPLVNVVRREFAIVCAARRFYYAQETFCFHFRIEESLIPETVGVSQLQYAAKEVGLRLLPRSKLLFETCERFYRIRRSLDDYTEHALLEYLVRKELAALFPEFDVNSWLPPTGNCERFAFVNLVDGYF